MAVLGLILLAAAVIIGGAAVLSNSGNDATVGDFTVFGNQLEITSGQILLYGAVLGAVAALGFNLMLVGFQHNFKRRMSSRHDLKAEKQRNAHLEAALAERQANDGAREQGRENAQINLTESNREHDSSTHR